MQVQSLAQTLADDFKYLIMLNVTRSEKTARGFNSIAFICKMVTIIYIT